MRKYLLPVYLFVLFLFAGAAAAQSDDDNVVILSKQETYEYKVKYGTVIIDNNNVTVYTCLKYPENVVEAEFYSSFSNIDKVSVQGVQYVMPQYEMYNRNGVFFSDIKACYFSMPFKKKDQTATVYLDKRYNDVTQFVIVPLHESRFIREKTVKFIVPEWMQLGIEGHNFNGSVSSEVQKDPQGKKTVYTYRIQNYAPIKNEEAMPDMLEICPYLVVTPRKAILKDKEVTYFENYDDVYKWCRDMASSSLNDTVAVGNAAFEITRACKTDEEKIKALYAWVQNNIRYIAFEYGLEGYIPDPAQNVLKKKYGDCKGMSNLLKLMLRSLGFDARLVWINTEKSVRSESMTVPYFNHVICALWWEDKLYFLDPTIKYMTLGECHNAIQGRMSLVEDGKSYQLIRVPEVPASQNTDSLVCNYRFDGGILSGRAMMVLTGEAKQYVLSSISALDVSKRNKAVKQFLENDRLQDRVSDISMDGVDSHGNKVTITYKEDKASGIQYLGDEIYIGMDARKDMANSSIDTAKRKNDFLLPYSYKVVREESVAIPEGYKVSYLPGAFSASNGNCSVEIKYSAQDGILKYSKQITLSEPHISKADFGQWDDLIAKLRKYYNENVILTKIKTADQ